VLATIAAEHQSTPHQIALAFLTRRPSLFAIPKSSHPDRAAANARAADVPLTADEIALIDAAFPTGSRRRGVPTL
jgi:diketogulonate reductase-like aldo/keto reductase